MAVDRRVKLVFADELGRLLLRKRGFSSCWFLVPSSAKIVGDLAHEIRHEFGLSVARCPSGVDLVLEKLHLLPSHDIRIVRDNDEICVQCSSSSDSADAVTLRRQSQQRALLETSGDEEEIQQHEKRKDRHGKNEKKNEKKNEAVNVREEAKKKLTKEKREEKTQKHIAKEPEVSGESSSSDSDDDAVQKQQFVAASTLKKRKVVSTSVKSISGSSSNSSSDSSDSSSSDSESDGKQSAKITLQPERKRQRMEVNVAMQKQLQPLKAVLCTAKKSALVPGKANGEGEPRQRRRRRPRNRKPREERTKRPSENGTTAPMLTTRSGALPTALGDNPKIPPAVLPPPVAESQQLVDFIAISQSTESTSAAIVKGHVRFGDAGESQVVQRTSGESNGSSSVALNTRKPRAYVSQELQKYGPQHNASNGRGQQQQEKAPRSASVATERFINANHSQLSHQRTNGHQSQDPVTAQTSQDAAVDPLANGGSSKKKKAKWENLWKRPYEIVATIHDQPQSQSDEADSSVVSPSSPCSSWSCMYISH